MTPISAIIPTFNRAPLLGRAIESVLNQTVPPRQVIVIDDGSTDETAEVCRPYLDRIEYVRQTNAGASAARNRGIELALHPWVAFLDSDDYWAPFHLENMVSAIEETDGEGNFYFCDMQLSTQEGGGTLWEFAGFYPSGLFNLTRDATGWMLMRRQPTMLQCSVFNRKVLQSSGGFGIRFRLMHDSELFCRLGIGAAVCAVSGAGCIQTADAESSNRLTGVVATGSEQHLLEQSMLRKTVLDRFPQMDSRYKQYVRAGLADSYWRLSRFYWRAGKILLSLWNFLRAAVSDPAFIILLLLTGSSKGYLKRVSSLQESYGSSRPKIGSYDRTRKEPAAGIVTGHETNKRHS